MRTLLLATLVLSLSGCAAIDSIDMMAIKKASYGYKHYDPCIRCGEKWGQQIPNWEHEAVIRRSRGEQW